MNASAQGGRREGSVATELLVFGWCLAALLRAALVAVGRKCCCGLEKPVRWPGAPHQLVEWRLVVDSHFLRWFEKPAIISESKCWTKQIRHPIKDKRLAPSWLSLSTEALKGTGKATCEFPLLSTGVLEPVERLLRGTLNFVPCSVWRLFFLLPVIAGCYMGCHISRPFKAPPLQFCWQLVQL